MYFFYCRVLYCYCTILYYNYVYTCMYNLPGELVRLDLITGRVIGEDEGPFTSE